MLKAEMASIIDQQQAQIDELTREMQLREMIELLREQNALLRGEATPVQTAPTTPVVAPTKPAPTQRVNTPKVKTPKAPNSGGGRGRRSDLTDPEAVAQLMRHGSLKRAGQATAEVQAKARAINEARRAAAAAERAAAKPMPKAEPTTGVTVERAANGSTIITIR